MALPESPTSILLVRLGGLGDLLTAMPSIRLVRHRFPDCRLTLVCREEYGTLLVRTGLVESIEPASSARFSRLYAASAPDAGEARSWPAGFDLVLGWMHGTSGQDLEDAFARRGIPVCVLVRNPHDHLSLSRGFFEATLRALDPSGRPRVSFEDCFGFPLGEDILADGRALARSGGIDPGSSFVAIHPGAGSRKKRWPVQNFLEVAARLSAAGRPGVILTGEADAELRPALGRASLPQNWKHLDQPGLASVAGLLAGCSLYLGNDSGITHLAAASGARILALYRMEYEAVWRPEGRSIVLSAEDVEALPVETVLAAAERILSGPGPEILLHSNLCKKP